MNRIIHYLKHDFSNYFKSESNHFPPLIYSSNAVLRLAEISISPLSRIKSISFIFRKCILLSFRSIEFQVLTLIPIDNHSLRLRWNFNGITRLTSTPKDYQGTILFTLVDSIKISQITLESIHPMPSSFPVKPLIWYFSKPALYYKFEGSVSQECKKKQ